MHGIDSRLTLTVNRPVDLKLQALDAPDFHLTACRGLIVFLNIFATWCGPCRAVGPVLEALAGERAGKIKIAKLNVDENPQSAARFAVQAIPTMILFRGPLEIDQIRGALPKAALEARLDRAI